MGARGAPQGRKNLGGGIAPEQETSLPPYRPAGA